MTNESFQIADPIDGLPSEGWCMAWYSSITGWDPRPESKWGDAFAVFRLSVIVQGIAARRALRQASSAQAEEYAARLKPIGEFTWTLVKRAEAASNSRSSRL